tara:strand:+ start:6456 stop:7217 length:762 start_codon:yes stop_codon:yes gene_type:complete
MENITETTTKEVSKSTLGFFKFVFNFEDDNKNEMLNLFQYALLGIIPVLITLKVIKHLIPEEDESKGNLEILAETVGQMILMLTMIWFIDRMIRYIPTFSETPYSKFTPINFTLPFLIILSTMQTKLGAKFNILINRTVDIWQGNKYDQDSENTAQKGKVSVSQPLAGQGPPRAQPTPNYNDNSQLLPANRQLTSMPTTNQQHQMAPQQSPNFNNMYQDTPNPLVDAHTPGDSMQEPMAANEAFGGMFGGSAW